MLKYYLWYYDSAIKALTKSTRLEAKIFVEYEYLLKHIFFVKFLSLHMYTICR